MRLPERSVNSFKAAPGLYNICVRVDAKGKLGSRCAITLQRWDVDSNVIPYFSQLSICCSLSSDMPEWILRKNITLDLFPPLYHAYALGYKTVFAFTFIFCRFDFTIVTCFNTIEYWEMMLQLYNDSVTINWISYEIKLWTLTQSQLIVSINIQRRKCTKL